MNSNKQDNFDQLLEKLSSPDPNVRKMTVTRLMWLDDSRAIGPLINALDDESPRVRATAALGLGRFKSSDAIPSLLHHLANDPDGHVRAMCAGALCPEQNEQVLECIISALKDEDWHVRMTAVASLKQIVDQRVVEHLLQMLDDPSWYVSHTVCEVLVEMGVGDERIVATIDRLHHEPEGQEYEEQMTAIGEFLQTLYENPEIAYCITEFDGRPVDKERQAEVNEIAEIAQERLKDEPPPPQVISLKELALRAKELLESNVK